MSEYQYYEFIAIDHRLTPKQIAQVRRFSTRAEISSTRFINEYHFGDFHGDPDHLVAEYFDVMFYFANWGTHRLLIGLPGNIEMNAWKQYQCETTTGVEIRRKSGRILVEFSSDAEEGEYEEGNQEWADQLAPIREDLLGGDLRPLYIAWLASLTAE